MLRKIDYRIVLGAGLMLFGALLFLEQIGLLHGVSNIFWGAVLLLAGLLFLYIFANNTANWWALIPAFGLLGLGLDTLLPAFLGNFNGGFFLGGLGLSFFAIYWTNRSHWWGIIPGGVLLTLGLLAGFEAFGSAEASGGLFFLGLGLTFLLVAILPNPYTRMNWAYIPAAVLLVMGGLLLGQVTEGLIAYIWPVGLILAGLLVLLGLYRQNQE